MHTIYSIRSKKTAQNNKKEAKKERGDFMRPATKKFNQLLFATVTAITA